MAKPSTITKGASPSVGIGASLRGRPFSFCWNPSGLAFVEPHPAFASLRCYGHLPPPDAPHARGGGSRSFPGAGVFPVLYLVGAATKFRSMSAESRLAALPPGPFVRLAALLNDVKPGKDPISLALGDPSGAVPEFVKEALAREATPASAIIPPSPARRNGGRRRRAGSIAASA